MNYLAHAYLSFNQPGIIVGNLVSDFVKGRKKYDYPLFIQQGITLHRAIDEFTDGHFATKRAKDFFRPCYRLYSGAFVDIVYDHFLANDPTEFDEHSLQIFSEGIYHVIDQHIEVLPAGFSLMFPYMRTQNWLFNYRTRWGISRSFGGLVRRAAFLDESDTATAVFEENYNELEGCYKEFFPAVKEFAVNRLLDIQKL